MCLVVSLSALSGCSSKPSQIYAKNSDTGSYFTIPYGWHLITESELSKRESKSTADGAADRAASVLWQEAYSPSKKVTAKDVFALDAPSSPIAFVRVRSLLPNEVNEVSYNFLRDIFVPLTTWLNSSTDSSSSPLPMTGFGMINESEFIAKSAHGVRSTFSFTGQGDKSQTFDQTAVVSDDRTLMYILLVRSTTDYYQKHSKELDKISQSFTIRGAQ